MKFLLLFLFVSTNAIAQSTYWTKSKVAYVYNLTDEQAKILMTHDFYDYRGKKKDKLILPDAFYNQPIDTIYLEQNKAFKTSSTSFRLQYPVGHYLAVYAEGEHLKYSYFSNYDIGIVPLMLKKKFQFHVIDSLGNYIEADKVTSNKKTLSYQKNEAIYKLGKFYNNRLVTVEHNGRLYFFEIERDEYYGDNWVIHHWDEFLDSDLFYYPLDELGRFGKRLYWRLSAFWRFQTYGYITTNKPKYQPNDTLKIKAYLVRENNIPHNSPLTLKIGTYNQTKIETTVKPTSKGNYIYELPLGDSLTLDKTYSVSFWKGKKQLIGTSFKYEDYQLDEVNFNLHLKKEAFKRNEPIIFHASAQNTNGQNILDGAIEILVKSNAIDDYFAPKVFVPDTLFYYKGAFIPNDLNGDKMRFVIPKENLPLANLDFTLEANFSNANGELQQKKKKLNLNADPKSINMRYEGDTLLIDYLVDGQSVAAKGMLEMTIKDSDFYIEKTIQLPYKTVGKTSFQKITVYVENRREEMNFKGRNNTFISKPNFDLMQTKDSVFVFGYNPNGLKVHYTIYRINKKIASGTSSEKVIIWNDKIRNNSSYKVDYEYIVGGKGEIKSKHFNYATNQLNIKIDQPEVIQPGETVDIKIKVKKHNSRNARNVNLAAGAVNTQFKNVEPWNKYTPFYGDYSKYRNDALGDSYGYDYNISAYDNLNWPASISPNIQKLLHLEEALYYQFLLSDSYLDNKINIQSDTTIAQFAPFLVKDKQFQPIYLIYVNRKLVYYHDTQTPYSFKGRDGFNQITVRGRDFELTIDSIYLEKGKKVNFVINLDNLPENAKLTKQPTTWTGAEKRILRNSIFSFQRTDREINQIYVWQDDVIYPCKIDKSVMKFGPFEAGQPIHFMKKNAFYTTFDFKPQFNYELDKNQQRLYLNDFMASFDDIELPNISSRSHIEDTLFLSRKIAVFDKDNFEASIPLKLKMAFSKVTFEKKENIRYHFRSKEVTDSIFIRFIFINKTNNEKFFYKKNTYYSQILPTEFGNLPKGNYQMYGYTDWGNYFTREVEILNDTIVCEYSDTVHFQLDTNLTLLTKILNLQIDYKESLGENYIGKSYKIKGTINDVNGEGVIGATIQIKGTELMTTTDLDGNYSINIPTIITVPILVVNYIGMNTQEVEVRSPANDYNIVLSESAEMLDEVVVVGYGVQKKKSLTGAIARLSTNGNLEQQLSGKVAGVSVVEDNSTKIMVRGAASFNKSDIRRNSNIESYNSNDEDGFFTEHTILTDTTMLNQYKTSSKIRSKFRDYAFWQPNLKTDNKGEATFRVTYPDDITSFQTFVLGMDKKHNFGIATKNVKSQKMALAQLAIPRFMIQGDKANIIGKSLNYSNDSLRIKSTFLSDNNVLKTNDFWLENVKIETAEIIANTDKDTLQLTYKMENAKFFDGEKRPIPIYKKGIQETVGNFNILTGDTTVVLNFDQSKGNVKIYAQTDVLEVLLKDVQYLIDYPYGCNEQTASRLMALLMDKKIKTTLGQNPPKDKAIIKMVKRLEKTQNADGSWGWWTGNKVDYWMTNYVLKALYQANSAGFSSASYERGLRFITNSLSQIEGQNLLNSLELLSDVEQNMDYKKYLAKLDSTIRYNDYYNQLRMIKIKQQQGLSYDLNVLDTLEKSTLFGNIFYDNKTYNYWYSNHYNLTKVAYEILRKENPNDAKLAAIRGYFLEKRTRYGWRNTFTTAQILSTILPDMGLVGEKGQTPLRSPTLVVKGNTTQTVKEFPFETIFYANTPLEIQKTGTSTVYLTSYQQFWNETPKSKNDIFELKTQFFQDGTKDVGRFESVRHLTTLNAKTPTKMVVTLEVKKEAEYVMVEIPIPAGCSYGEKSKNYGWYGREVHREYFREKTCVFYQNLPVGTYTIEINLEPRFTGEYTVNPAKAEQMYFPIFYGQNAIKEVEIK